MLPIAILTVLALGVSSFLVAWVLYIVAQTCYSRYLKANSDGTRLLFGLLTVVFGVPCLVLDIAWNWTYGLVLGATWDLTLSGKLDTIREMVPGGWRRDVADFVCQHMLNPYDPRGPHC